MSRDRGDHSGRAHSTHQGVVGVGHVQIAVGRVVADAARIVEPSRRVSGTKSLCKAGDRGDHAGRRYLADRVVAAVGHVEVPVESVVADAARAVEERGAVGRAANVGSARDRSDLAGQRHLANRTGGGVRHEQTVVRPVKADALRRR